jgi:hypothetical protein
MRVEVLALDATDYRPHWLHARERIWQETNCAADYVIELLHALEKDPVPGLGFTLSGDFDGDQWRMFKFPDADLRELYGIETYELNLWRKVTEQLAEQICFGRVVALDVDAFYLPDTAGTTYHSTHHKTSIIVQMIDPEQEVVGYFHNAGYFELDARDFGNLLGKTSSKAALPPFAEVFCLEQMRGARSPEPGRVFEVARSHLERRRPHNPVTELGKRIASDLELIAGRDVEYFHHYAFGTLRQFGANAELASSFASWLASELDLRAELAGALFGEVARLAKTLQFSLARAARGRRVDFEESLGKSAVAWEQAMRIMSECLVL